MTTEDKELLLKDLSARLLYGVKIEIPCVFAGKEELKGLHLDIVDNIVTNESGDKVDIEKVLIYLRPMSSMTEEEKEEFETLGWRVDELNGNAPWNHSSYNVFDGVDWLNAHHFDYRELIQKGLALIAPKDMYKF